VSRRVLPGVVALAIAVLVLGSWGLGPIAHLVPGEKALGARLAITGGSLQITSFSFSPNPVSVNSNTHGSVSVSGGTPPYLFWFNNTPPGCSPPNNPASSPSPSFQFGCSPSSPGTYSVHLDVLDSSSPPNRTSQTASLTVNGNPGGSTGGTGNGNGSKSGSGINGSLLPSGVFAFVLLFGFIFLGALIAIAAGTIATAVLVSRRLRQINETLTKTQRETTETKPPP
jgi:hypothetical protein